ncbi:MAG: hypothetical protein Q6361_03105, partial [Candidatus Hermodarchaeota archaeon]|nr:hypothetical protein [Candidatus Hermodarchaeota archaeon]
PRRVRRLIEEFTMRGAIPELYLTGKAPGDYRTKQACFYFQVVRDLNGGGYTAFITRVLHDGDAETRTRIVEHLKERYPLSFFYAYTSAFEPILFCIFVVEHIREGSDIINSTRQLPGVISTEALYGYPTKRFPGLFDTYFEDIFKPLENE